MSPKANQQSPSGLRFPHPARGGIDPGGLPLHPRVVGVVEIWKDFWSGDGNLSPPGCQSAIGLGLRFPHRAGRFPPGGSPLSSPGCQSCKGVEGYLIREWKPILPGVRWLYVRSQPVSDRPVWLGFLHHAGRFRPGGSPLSSPRCRSCTCIKGFLNRGWGNILPGVRWL